MYLGDLSGSSVAVRFVESLSSSLELVCSISMQTNAEPLLMDCGKLERVDRFTYFSSCICANENIAEEIYARIAKAQAAFSNLRYLWRCKNISSITKGGVCDATVHPTLLFGREMWILRSEDVFHHRVLALKGSSLDNNN